MAIGRFVARAISGVVALAVGLLVLIPVGVMLAAISIPVLIMLAVAGAIGAIAMLSVGLPSIIVGVLALIAIAAAVIFLGGAIKVGVFFLKILLFGLLLSWLARRVFGWRGPISRRGVLVGPPIADVPAPSHPGPRGQRPQGACRRFAGARRIGSPKPHRSHEKTPGSETCRSVWRSGRVRNRIPSTRCG